MGYTHIVNQLCNALEDTYKVTSKRWFDKNWNGVDAIIKALNVELAYILDSNYEAYVKCVDGFISNNTIKCYSIAIKDWKGRDVMYGKIHCYGMGAVNTWNNYELTCQLYCFEE